MNPLLQSEIQRIVNVVDDLIEDLSILQFVPSVVESHGSGGLSHESIESLDEKARLALSQLHEAERELRLATLGSSVDGNRRNNQEEIDNQRMDQNEMNLDQNELDQNQLDQQNQSDEEEGEYMDEEQPSQSTQPLHLDQRQNIEYIQQLSEIVKQKTRALCHYFRHAGWNPTHNDERSITLARYLQKMLEYRQILNDRLNTTVEEEQSRREVKNETSAREKKASADVKALQRELASERSARDRELTEREQAVKKLRSKIQMVQDSHESTMVKKETEHTSMEKQKRQEFEMMKNYLLKQIANIREQLEKKKEENQQLEVQLRVMRKNNETKVGSIVQKYDQFMFETTEKLKQLKEDFEEDTNRVIFLEKELADFSESRKASLESESKRQDILRRNILKAQSYVNAKLVIMRAWQDYKKRNVTGKKKRRTKRKS